MRRVRTIALLLLLLTAFAADAANVLYLAGASQSGAAKRAFRSLQLPADIRFRMIADGSDAAALNAAIAEADLVIANGLVAEFRDALAAAPNLGKVRIHLLGTEALRPRIPEKLLKHCVFPMDETVAQYRAHPTGANLRNLVCYIVGRELDRSVRADPPELTAKTGVIDPFSGKVYPSYRAWRAAHPAPADSRGRAAVLVYGASATPDGSAFLRPLCASLTARGIEPVVFFGDEVRLIKNELLDRRGRPRVDLVIAFAFKFKAGLSDAMKRALVELDLPVVNALTLYRQTTEEWRASPQGMNAFSVAFAMIAPEVSGLIEPTLLYGREMEDGTAVHTPMPENMARLADRAAKWIELRKKPAAEKRVALFFYHPEGGKQAIGASYLNVPRSICAIASALASAGYRTGGAEKLTEKALTDRLLAGVRNVGSWAPGELDALCAAGDCVTVDFAQYRKWFAELPAGFRASVVREWGEPEDAKMMARDGAFVIPVLKTGNLAILPEPMRGYLGDLKKLYHSATLAPPHQYVAVYLWLRRAFKADAVIHLGRHGSHEWLPGKQLGLSPDCAPAVLGGDMASFYPYIADGIGEGIMVKRRGAGVILSHLTPALGKAGTDRKAAALAEAINAYQSADPARKSDALARVRALAQAGTWMHDAGIADFSEASLHRLQHYLEDLREAVLPYGLHTYGAAPGAAEIAAMAEQSGLTGAEKKMLTKHLENAGSDEMDSLLRGLSGRFVRPGLSGDPVRSPASLPVGRNFYGFDPDKFPTREAFARAGQTVEKLIADYRAGHGGAYPARTAIVLWAGESVRTGGLNESILLHLIGMEPEHDRNGRVRGFRPIPAAKLGRPRLDAVVTTSGAYRDQFAGLLAKLDRAQRDAAKLTDVENYLARHNRDDRAALEKRGVSPADAERAASRRIYSPAPGSYGVGVNRLAGASGVWENNAEIAQVYLERMRYGMDADGGVRDAGGALAQQLKNAGLVLHSRSSTLYGVTDIDDMFQYMGGLALAVKTASGRAPGQFILDNRRSARVRVTPVGEFIAAELRTRTFDPAWIRAMQQENYAGARTMARMTDNLWGWQSVTPENVAPGAWQEMYEVFVKDRHRLHMREFFRRENAWAEQSVTARMLEAVRKGFWDAAPAVRTELARDYAASVIENGVACCDHTCNNPLLHQMVMDLISVPGVMTPETVAKFRVAVERAAKKSLSEQVRELREQRAKLGKARPEPAAASRAEGDAPKPVRGYKMKETRDDETRMSSSGIRWVSILILTGLIALFLFAARRG